VFLPYPICREPAYPLADQIQTTEQYEQADLQRRIDHLTDEVESLRQEEANKRPQPSVGEQKQELEASPTRILFFCDGHRSEIHNYAIVGDTLWDLTEERARKIPISDFESASQVARSTKVRDEKTLLRLTHGRSANEKIRLLLVCL